MVRTTKAILLAAATAALLLYPLSMAQGHQHGSPARGMAHGAPDGADQGAGHGMGAMAHSTDELSFLVHMIPHHQEAIDSAILLLAVTERAELQSLANSIIAVQQEEIAWMERYLERWYPNASRDAHYQPMMRLLGTEATVAEIEQAFLEDMIPHHMMAVHESQNLLAGGWAEREEVADLARAIMLNQIGEIMLMRAWLVDWFGVLPMGMMGGGHGNHEPAEGRAGDGEATGHHHRSAPGH